jgi:rhodanese-related sulfurtransferase
VRISLKKQMQMALCRRRKRGNFWLVFAPHLLISKSTVNNESMDPIRSCLGCRLVISTLLILLSIAPLARAADSTNIRTLSIEELVHLLAGKGAKPLLFQVGSHMLYVQAHIPNSEYIGAGNTPEGIQRLRQRVSGLPKNADIVLYCGCCPWDHCPNVNPAYETLQRIGFTNVRVLYIANNFGADWVDKGYPVARGD